MSKQSAASASYEQMAAYCDFIADLYGKAKVAIGAKPVGATATPLTLSQKMRNRTYHMRAHAEYCDIIAAIYDLSVKEGEDGEGFLSGVVKAEYEAHEEEEEGSSMRMSYRDELMESLLAMRPSECAAIIRKRADSFKERAEDYRARAAFHAK